MTMQIIIIIIIIFHIQYNNHKIYIFFVCKITYFLWFSCKFDVFSPIFKKDIKIFKKNPLNFWNWPFLFLFNFFYCCKNIKFTRRPEKRRNFTDKKIIFYGYYTGCGKSIKLDENNLIKSMHSVSILYFL